MVANRSRGHLDVIAITIACFCGTLTTAQDQPGVHEPDRELVRRFFDESPDGPFLNAVEASEDLHQLQAALESQYAYLTLNGVDYQRALHSIGAALGERIHVADFQLQLAQLLCRFGDGHTRVRGVSGMLEGPCLPFGLHRVDGRIVAIERDTTRPLQMANPVLASIDGVPIERWLEAVFRFAPAGTAQLQWSVAQEHLGHAGFLRAILGLKQRPAFEIRLESADGSSNNELTVLAASEPGDVDRSWRADWEWIDRDGKRFVLLRLPTFSDSINPEHLDVTTSALQAASESEGVIIDVRGNGGGSRDALRLIMPCLMQRDAGPTVCNVAAYRLDPEFGRDHLESRFMFRRDDDRWSDAERRAIDVVAARFEPDWELPAGQFSEWHYLVIGPAGAIIDLSGKPLAVLQDGGCFSATDIFLGAMSQLPGVTTMGTTSGGGSGRARQIVLRHSEARILLSSMASFRPDGTRYDGKGVEPRVIVAPTVDDFVEGRDPVLERAVEVLVDRD